MLGRKSFDPYRKFGCFKRLFCIVVGHFTLFMVAVVESQVLRIPFVERLDYTLASNLPCSDT